MLQSGGRTRVVGVGDDRVRRPRRGDRRGPGGAGFDTGRVAAAAWPGRGRGGDRPPRRPPPAPRRRRRARWSAGRWNAGWARKSGRDPGRDDPGAGDGRGRVAGFTLTRHARRHLLSDAGLRPGDVLTEVNGVPIDSLATLIGLWPRMQTEPRCARWSCATASPSRSPSIFGTAGRRRRELHPRRAVLGGCVLLAARGAASAWGFAAHASSTRRAVETLPDPLRRLVHRQRGLGGRARDRRRPRARPLRRPRPLPRLGRLRRVSLPRHRARTRPSTCGASAPTPAPRGACRGGSPRTIATSWRPSAPETSRASSGGGAPSAIDRGRPRPPARRLEPRRPAHRPAGAALALGERARRALRAPDRAGGAAGGGGARRATRWRSPSPSSASRTCTRSRCWPSDRAVAGPPGLRGDAGGRPLRRRLLLAAV